MRTNSARALAPTIPSAQDFFSGGALVFDVTDGRAAASSRVCNANISGTGWFRLIETTEMTQPACF